MKAIFKDDIIAKLRKIPGFLWFFILAATYFFRDAYNDLATARSLGQEYTAAFAQLELEVNPTPMIVITTILTPIIAAAIFELIMRVVYSLLVRRYVMAINQNDFCFRIRLVMIIANIILGCVGIVYFFVSDGVMQLLNSIFEFAVPALLYMWFYEDFRARYVPQNRHDKLFYAVARVYVAIFFVINLISMIITVSAVGVPAIMIAAACVDVGMVVVVAVLAYLDYRRLQKIALEPEINVLFIKKDEEKDDNIFKDLGF